MTNLRDLLLKGLKSSQKFQPVAGIDLRQFLRSSAYQLRRSLGNLICRISESRLCLVLYEKSPLGLSGGLLRFGKS